MKIKYIIIFLAGLFFGLILSDFAMVKGNLTNERFGRDAITVKHYVIVNGQWIERKIECCK